MGNPVRDLLSSTPIYCSMIEKVKEKKRKEKAYFDNCVLNVRDIKQFPSGLICSIATIMESIIASPE